jgi:hypothetical protein
VAQAIPLHAMSVFKFPVSLCEDLMRMTRISGGTMKMTRKIFTSLARTS